MGDGHWTMDNLWVWQFESAADGTLLSTSGMINNRIPRGDANETYSSQNTDGKGNDNHGGYGQDSVGTPLITSMISSELKPSPVWT